MYYFVYRFAHYSKLHDVQTLALLACICQLQCLNVDEYFAKDIKEDKTVTYSWLHLL